MKSQPYIPSMVQAITVLTVLKMMTKAQTSCGSGGKIMYERLPNIQLQGFDDDIVRDTAPPFMVLEKCEDLCLRDRASNNLVRPCRSFDFQPGSRIANYNGGNGPDYEESTCYLTAEQARPEGLGTLMLVPNSVHFTEICVSSPRPDRECPNRRYIFERHPRKKLKLPNVDTKEMSASNRTDCEDLCLNEFSFICRSATFDANMRTCTLSRFTRRTHPELLQDDPDSDYLENMCLSADRRCDGLGVFIKEENKRLGGPFEVDMFTNISLEDCQAMCVRAEKYLCRSIEYDDMTKLCTLSEEDSVSQKDDIDISSSPTHHFYDFACLDSPRGSEYPDNAATSHLFSGKRPDTAFQRYRNSRLGGEHHSEISGRSLSECLDECLRQPSFQCKSAEYSERYRTCRLTRYNQKDGMRIIYDADYDYYENLMLGGDEENRPPPERDGYRPEGGRYPPRRPPPPGRFPPSGGGGRLPPQRYPPTEGGRYPPPGEGGRYPPPSDGGRYPPPPARYPPSGGYDEGYGGRYPPPPPHRYPYDRNPNYQYDRYPPRYPPRPIGPPPPERYLPPSGGGASGRYPPPPLPPPSRERYPPQRVPYPGGDRYDDRYDDRYPGGRYGGGRNRYDDRFRRPDDDRYDDRYDYEDASGRWYSRPRPRPPPPPARPYHDRDRLPYDVGAPTGNRRPISPGPDGPIYDNYPEPPPPPLPGRPVNLRCEDAESFRQVGPRLRARKEYIRRYTPASSLVHCQRECVDSRDFVCRSFNYREPYDNDRENCELSDRDTRDMEMDNPAYFDNTGGYDFYERSLGRQRADEDCLDVTQVCNEDGMEFTLRTPEGFYGRMYTYGNYDRCFFRGNGGTVNVLRISGAQGYPECGTQRYGESMTNIVVVQFSDYVQTGRDKRFNLTCLFRGPGESVVSSGFIGAGTGSPIPIEYLPAENTLSSKVRLMILYQGRPTTTIAVGDPLTLRLEALDGSYYPNDIFATNVVARDPYSGRSVQLIDRFGCPVDPFVFPELGKGRNSDTLEARFNAFKIPESNFLVFEATVRTCRDGCQPAYCPTGSGRAETSYGRRRRDVNATLAVESNNTTTTSSNDTTVAKETDAEEEYPEYVREMIEVFESREELQQEARMAVPAPETVCLTKGEYHTLVSAVLALIAVLLTVALVTGFAYRRYWSVMQKNLAADRASSTNLSSSYPNTRSSPVSGFSIFGNTLQKPFPGLGRSARNFPSLTRAEDLECPAPAPGGPFEDPSEPIYTDPSLFERSRSLRSISVTQKRRREQQD